MDEEEETDLPMKLQKSKLYKKTFYTDAEGKSKFRNRKLNSIKEENDKIDRLYFAVLQKIDK